MSKARIFWGVSTLLLGAGCSDASDTKGRSTADTSDVVTTDGVLFPDAPAIIDTGRVSDDVAAEVLDLEGANEVTADTAAPDTVGDTADTAVTLADTIADTAGNLDTRPPPDDSPCAAEQVLTVSVSLEPPSVMLVVDRSGSMYDRWDETVDAVDALVSEVGNTVRLGLALYPAASGCGVNAAPQVPIGPGGEVALLDALRASGTGGSTPMGRAMSAVRSYLEQNPQPGEVNVVLAADGKPSDLCLEDCEGCDCLDNDACEICADLIACTHLEVSKHVVALAGQGIRTWVIGYDGGFGATDFLESLAESGGTSMEGPSPFFDAGDGSQLGQILSSIAGSVETCTADVNEPAGYGYPVVTLDGVTVPRDATRSSGWEWVDEDTIRLYGEACERASEPGATLAISFVCK